MVESATKGAILLVAKESINDGLLAAGTDPFTAGILAGAGGGVFQARRGCSLSRSLALPRGCSLALPRAPSRSLAATGAPRRRDARRRAAETRAALARRRSRWARARS